MASRVPRAVQKQIEAAEQAAKELFESQEPVTQEPEGNTPPVEGTPGIVIAEPVVEPVAVEGVTTPTPIENKVEEDSFKHKYEVLSGKYNAEIARSNERITQLEKLLSNLADQKADQKSSEVTPPPVIEVPETYAELVAFEDNYPGVTQAILKLMDSKIKPVQEAAERVTSIETKLNKTTEESFYDKLFKAIPECVTINNDPLFGEWLSETIPYTNISRNQALQDAYHKFDHVTASQIFIDYKNSTQAPMNSEVIPPPVVDTSKFVAPPRGSRSGGAGTVAPKTTYKREEIELFYRNLAQKKLPWTKDQIAAKEKEYFQAMQEDRIV